MENKTIRQRIAPMNFLLTLTIIYITDSLLFATNASRAFVAAGRFGVIILAAVMLIRSERIKREKFGLVPVFLSVSIGTTMILSHRISNGYFYYTMIASIWFAYFYAREYSLEDFSYAFCKIMRVIAVVSLIAWLFAEPITSMGFIPVVNNSNGVPYKTLLFTNIPMSLHYAQRNMGPFWEPGAYQVYLNIALFLVLFVEKNNKKVFDSALFVITCLTTKSGAALAPMVMTICAYAIEERQIKSFFTVAILGSVIVYMFSTGMFDDITDKMSGNAETNSIIYRQIGIEGALKGFLANPVFGSSPAENEYIKMQLAIEKLGSTYSSNTNTYINYFAYFGIFVGGYMFIRAYKLFRKNATSLLASLLAFGAYFIATSNEELMTSLLIIVLTFLENEETLNKSKVKEELYEGCTNQCV